MSVLVVIPREGVMEEVSQHCSTGLADCCAGSDQPAVAAAAGSNEVSAQAAAANRDAADPKQVGRWDPTFKLPNVAIHAHLLPNGKVLFWGSSRSAEPEPRRTFLHSTGLGSGHPRDHNYAEADTRGRSDDGQPFLLRPRIPAGWPVT